MKNSEQKLQKQANQTSQPTLARRDEEPHEGSKQQEDAPWRNRKNAVQDYTKRKCSVAGLTFQT